VMMRAAGIIFGELYKSIWAYIIKLQNNY
jgi:hypothetical protein